MSVDLSNVLVIWISSRALFNMEEENEIFEKEWLEAFLEYQYRNEEIILKKWTSFPLIEAILNINWKKEKLVEIVIMSKNSPDISMRILNSIKYYWLDITRMVFSAWENVSPYLDAYSVDLFLSKNENDVQTAIDAWAAWVIVYDNPIKSVVFDKNNVKFAFDADAVIFSDESEIIYKEHWLDAFLKHELENENSPLNEWPFAKLLKILSITQKKFWLEESPIKIAIVTARSWPAHLRIIKTLREWGVYIDSAFFLGWIPKNKILEAYKPHFFFDDQDAHVDPASRIVPSWRVPYKSKSILNTIRK